MSAGAVNIRDYLEPLSTSKRGDGTKMTGDYFPVPLRTAMRIGLRILAIQSEDPEAKITNPRGGDHAPRLIAEDIIETFMRDEFTRKVGERLAVAQHFVVEQMYRGASEEEACRKFLAKIQAEEDADERATTTKA